MYRHERKILVGLAATFIIEMTAACVLMGLSVRLNGCESQSLAVFILRAALLNCDFSSYFSHRDAS